MALVIRTVMTYPLNGSTVDFAVTFEYLARKFVTVTLLGTDRKELVLNQDYRFTSKNQITLTKAWGPSDGYENIEVRRFTSATDRLVDFADGSILRAYDLNISQVQTLHVAEEARDLTADTIGVNNDGNLDARGRKIVNLGDGVSDGDAVTVRQQKGWAESALNQANRSKVEADKSEASALRAAASAAAAKVSENNSKTSEINSKASEDASKVSEGAAKASATLASNKATESSASAAAAKVSETNAKASELRAIEEASKLGNLNDFATTLQSVDTVTYSVESKGAHVLNGNLETKGDGKAIIDGTALIRDSLTVGGKTTGDAITTVGDITIGVRAGNTEGSQLNFKTKEGNQAGAIDVDSTGLLRILKAGQSAGAKMHWTNADETVMNTNRLVFSKQGGQIAPDTNMFSSIWRTGSLHGDVNSRTLIGDNYLATPQAVWTGDLVGMGPWNIGPVGAMLGRTLGIQVVKDGEYLWLPLQLSPHAEMKYTMAGRGNLSFDIRVYNNGQWLEITRVTNCNFTAIQIWR